MKIAAFFDIDGTLYRDSLMIEHFKKLIKYEVIDPYNWHSHVKHTYEEWKKRMGEYDDYMEELADIYIENLMGINIEEIDFLTEQVIKLQGDKVYSYTRKRIKEHLERKELVIFISGSPDFLVEKMAKKYGAETYKGSKYILKNGIFTGEVVPMWDADNKNRALKELKELYDIDFENSYAYGDTNGDLSMLCKVGYPTAINPTRELLENIKNDPVLSKKTKIIVERKDVIYDLSSNVSII